MRQPQAGSRFVAVWVESYPQQTGKMKGYLHKHGVPSGEVDDMISEAWTRALETYDQSYGLDLVQWVWHILQHNLLPGYWRDRKSHPYHEALEDDPPGETTQISEAPDPQDFVEHLRASLPHDLLGLFDAIQEVTAETDSQHIYKQVAERQNLSMPECRNRVKRLKRASIKIRKNYHQ